MIQDAEEPMTDNAALNSIVQQLASIENFLVGSYDTIEGDTDWRSITNVLSLARAADEDAIKTVVSNKGSNPVAVLEDGKIVCIVPPSESMELPLNGAGEIKWKCASGSSSSVAIATFKSTV